MVLVLAEFSCLICREVMTLPLTTPCAHNFCKLCLEGAFAGQTFVKERTCEGRRTLRTQKNIMKCPSCPMEISDFLQNPQVWPLKVSNTTSDISMLNICVQVATSWRSLLLKRTLKQPAEKPLCIILKDRVVQITR